MAFAKELNKLNNKLNLLAAADERELHGFTVAVAARWAHWVCSSYRHLSTPLVVLGSAAFFSELNKLNKLLCRTQNTRISLSK